MMNKNKQGVYAPDYYKEFKCIADKCRHSCCVDWEICIDKATYEKYVKMDDVLGTIKEDETGPCFELCADGRCPHLNDVGLCKIILSHGEEYLSEICKKHPRFYNHINGGRTEAGLGIVCEEACRLILENEKPFSLSLIEDSAYIGDYENDFNALPKRERIISIIETDGEFDDKLNILKKEFELTELRTPENWLSRFLSLEILNGEWKEDLSNMKGRPFFQNSEITDRYGKCYERLLTYFVYRHVSIAYSEQNLRARLAFCILSVNMIRYLFEENLNKKSISDTEEILELLIDISRRYSAEIEYSEDNVDELIFAFESKIF